MFLDDNNKTQFKELYKNDVIKNLYTILKTEHELLKTEHKLNQSELKTEHDPNKLNQLKEI